MCKLLMGIHEDYLGAIDKQCNVRPELGNGPELGGKKKEEVFAYLNQNREAGYHHNSFHSISLPLYQEWIEKSIGQPLKLGFGNLVAPGRTPQDAERELEESRQILEEILDN